MGKVNISQTISPSCSQQQNQTFSSALYGLFQHMATFCLQALSSGIPPYTKSASSGCTVTQSFLFLASQKAWHCFTLSTRLPFFLVKNSISTLPFPHWTHEFSRIFNGALTKPSSSADTQLGFPTKCVPQDL